MAIKRPAERDGRRAKPHRRVLCNIMSSGYQPVSEPRWGVQVSAAAQGAGAREMPTIDIPRVTQSYRKSTENRDILADLLKIRDIDGADYTGTGWGGGPGCGFPWVSAQKRCDCVSIM